MNPPVADEARLPRAGRSLRTRPVASVSLDLDNHWSYLKTHGDPQWEDRPSYLDVVVRNPYDREATAQVALASSDDWPLPEYATSGSAAVDLRNAGPDVVLEPMQRMLIPTALAIALTALGVAAALVTPTVVPNETAVATGIVATLVAFWLWWIANWQQQDLRSPADPDDPVGGDEVSEDVTRCVALHV